MKDNIKTTDSQTGQDGKLVQFCTFHVAGRHYGVEILKVKEITGETEFTPVFHAPREVKGYVNIRGQINLVIDIRPLLGFEAKDTDDSSRVVLFKPEVGESFGILVDKIGDVVKTPESKIEWKNRSGKPSGGHEHATHFNTEEIEAGVCKLETSLLVLLDPAKVLSSVQESISA